MLVAPKPYSQILTRYYLNISQLTPLLLNPKGVPFRDSLDLDLAEENITLTAKAEVDGMRLASLAADGFGAAVLPATAAQGSEKMETNSITRFHKTSGGLHSKQTSPAVCHCPRCP